MSQYYDYILVGAGPAGLTLAHIFASLNKTCLILEKESSIGGCHRVTRVDNLFTEHGPRVYFEGYLNSKQILSNMNIEFDKIFTDYPLNFSDIKSKILDNFTLHDIFAIIKIFIYFILDPEYGKTTTVQSFIDDNNISKKGSSTINKLCVSTKGDIVARYSVHEFLNLLNTLNQKLYQPRLPNDKGLFMQWATHLKNTNLVDIKLNQNITKIVTSSSSSSNNKINKVEEIHTSTGNIYKSSKFILAVPPKALVTILNKFSNIKNSFGNFQILNNWANPKMYTDYINIVYHWDTPISYPDSMIFPQSYWGILFIKLSSYTKFTNKDSKTVISAAISVRDVKSPFIGKTANQCNKDELIKETLRQIRETMPNLPEPTRSIVPPQMYRENGQWKSTDSLFTKNISSKIFNPQSQVYKNLFSVGSHNGYSNDAVTTMETAVTNAIVFASNLYPEIKNKYILDSFIGIRDIIILVILVILIIIILIIIAKYKIKV